MRYTTVEIAVEAVSRAAMAYVLLLLLLSTAILVAAAFLDRKRGREIENDRSRLLDGRPKEPRRDEDGRNST